MVALNEQFTPKNPEPGPKNRVGNFFGENTKSSRVNRLPGQQPRRGNGCDYDETASGMFFYGFRYYDPVTGRWPSRDPLGEGGGLNLYVAAENDVINRVDMLGLCPTCPDCEGDYTACKDRAEAEYQHRLDVIESDFNTIKAEIDRQQGVCESECGTGALGMLCRIACASITGPARALNISNRALEEAAAEALKQIELGTCDGDFITCKLNRAISRAAGQCQPN